jgi:hypothetical protein
MFASKLTDQLFVGEHESAVSVIDSMSRHARHMYRSSGIGLRPRGTTVRLMDNISNLAGRASHGIMRRASLTE